MKLNENTKITLTIGQIKRLINEENEVAQQPQQTVIKGLTQEDLQKVVKILDGAEKNGRGIKLNDSAKGIIRNEILNQSNGQINAKQADQIVGQTMKVVENPRFAKIAGKVARMALRNPYVLGPAGFGLAPATRIGTASVDVGISRRKKFKELRKSGASFKDAFKQAFGSSSRDAVILSKEIIKNAVRIEPFEKAFIKKCLLNPKYWFHVIKVIITVLGSSGVGTATIAPDCIALGTIATDAAVSAEAETAANQQQTKVAESFRRYRRMRRLR